MNDTYKPLTIKLAWNLAAPGTWVASACPAIFAILYSRIQGYPLRIWMYPTLVLACILLQSAVNTLNDYMDFIKGTDSEQDVLEEADAVLIYGGIAPASALRLGLAFLAAGILLGLTSGLWQGLLPLGIGLIGVLVIALYSCGPHPISYLPIGELISGFVMGGLIPLGVCACADGRLHMEVLPASIPFILGIAMIMLCNNGCDIEKDMQAGRSTFPAMVGRQRALTVYRLLIVCWVAALLLEPVLLIGRAGLLSLLLFLLIGRKPYQMLWHLKLEPARRILQMQTIAKANLLGHGILCLNLFLYCLLTAAGSAVF